MSNSKRSIFTPELSTVKSLNEADTNELWIPAQQVTDDAVVKVSLSFITSSISGSSGTVDHQSTTNRENVNAHPQYALTSSLDDLENTVTILSQSVSDISASLALQSFLIEREMFPAGEGLATQTARGLTSNSQFAGQTTRITFPTGSMWLARQTRIGVQASTIVNSVAGQATQPRIFSAAIPTEYTCMFGVTGSAINDMRLAVGLFNSNNSLWSSTTEPSTVSWAGVFFGFDSTDTNMFLMHKPTSVNATKINLGTDFAREDGMSCHIVLNLSASQIDYRIRRLDKTGSAQGSISTALMPEAGAKMCWYWFCSNTTGGTVAAIDMIYFKAVTRMINQ